jgi:hypothetical protein
MTFETVSREMTKLRDLQIIDLLGLRKFKIQRAAVLQSLALTGSLASTHHVSSPASLAFTAKLPSRRSYGLAAASAS